ncbi:glycoside hydrolase family 3 N-terminal domain-containing protein [Bifidobacterium sp. ESL0704]|uniref:beta-glucosidase n=1 Tax=Bifidobacterium sp. ESL0704 TaxID=2983219 RepID=UPI0023F634A1|nr:glycoside hydrolase family 3 N-terminal domain-containing protein [Bifidobacterium sp. ESL0704]WEV53459.1 glycoside hydrolase family 3 C-terminal domain-containing protein [Bifidobacterium sp. ESL0704]
MDVTCDTSYVDELISSMTLTQKVGQLNQRLFGWKCLKRVNGKLMPTDYLKAEIDRWGGLGVLYGLFRADPWSEMNWDNGIRPQERLEAASIIQQTVLERGAHGIGVLLSEEAPHGHQALGGTILPTNLALGATFDPALVQEAQRAVGRQLYESGVHIALVSGLDIARDPRWGRCEECFGEDPCLAARMCKASIEGMQGVNRSLIGHGGVAVVMKHLAAQGEAIAGRNGQSAVLGPNDLHEIHLRPVAASVNAGACGFMAAYNDIDGVPCCANPWLLKTYLRDELHFNGIVMADGLAVDRLASMTGSLGAAGLAALLSGVNVSLWDEGFASLDVSVSDMLCADGERRFNLLGRSFDVDAVEDAIDQSLRRVLLLKQRFSLLPPEKGKSTSSTGERETVGLVGADEQSGRVPGVPDGRGEQLRRALDEGEREALACAQACLVALKDDGAADWNGLGDGPIVVTGALADDAMCFYGDYTAPLPAGRQTTVYRQMRQMASGRDVRLLPMGEKNDALLHDAALIVNVAGGTSERSYQEAFADNGAAGDAAMSRATGGEGVDLASIDLPWHQDEWLRYVRAASSSPVVSVVVSGRAQVLTRLCADSDKVIWAGYAGPYGPQSVSSVILGHEACTGAMPVTLPFSDGVSPLHYNDRQSASDVYKDAKDPVLYPFGFSLAPARRVSRISVESAHALRVVSHGRDTLIEVCRQADLKGKVRITMTLDVPESLRGRRNQAVKLYIRTSGGSMIPRVCQLAAVFDTCRPSSSQHLISSQTLSYETIFDGKEGNTVELLDDERTPYGVITPVQP